MGIIGRDGVFKRCCETTMNVLRTNHASLLTILEVFIHDPLYKWALSPLQALRLQRDENEVESNLEEVNLDNNNPGSSTGNTDAEVISTEICYILANTFSPQTKTTRI